MHPLKFATAFERERFVLNIFGLYPEVNNSSCWTLLRQLIYITVACIQLGSASMQMLISSDFNKVLDCYIYFINQSNFFCKVIQLHRKKNVLETLRLYIEGTDESNIPAGFRKTLAKREIIRSRFGTFYRVAVFVFTLVQIFIICIQENRTFLPMNSWTPFDISHATVYYLTFGFQLSGIVASSICDTSVDCLYYILADIACCQLDILKENLKRVRPNRDLIIKGELTRSVKYHQNIIEFVQNIEEVFSNILFLEFLKSVVEICFTGFELTVIEFPSLRFFMQIIYFIGMFLEILSFCWFGHLLMMKSIEVEDVCYMIKWDECSILIQRMLLIIMIRAHKPLVIKAVFLKFSMGTLTTILRSSYSYTTVLRTLYN